MNWHQATAEASFDILDTGPSGLTEEEALRRRVEFGPNEIETKKARSPVVLFMDQFKDFMIIVLIAAALVSGFVGEAVDTIAIIVILILNATIGFVQEYRAERAIEALKVMAAPSTTVLRNGKARTITTSELVPGDIVTIEAGAIIPADARLFEVAQLKIDESALTGESVAVEKTSASIKSENILLGDRTNMAYGGTFATYGRGIGVVVTTGMKTEFGKIAALIQEAEEIKTPLQKRLAIFGKYLALAAIAISFIVFAVGVIRGEPLGLIFLTAISLAVAAIPEALPAVITIALAFGAKRMVRNRALVRRLPAVESLGSVTFICSDKTGTLTENKMKVEEVYVGTARYHVTGTGYRPTGEFVDADDRPAVFVEDQQWRLFFRGLALNNDATLLQHGETHEILGDPTEAALLVVAAKAGLTKEDAGEQFPRLAEIPFDSERKLMTTVHAREGGGFVSYTKGALDVILGRAAGELTPSLTVSALSRKRANELAAIGDEMASQGLRVLGLACKFHDSLPPAASEVIEEGLVFVGMVGIVDPPRPEAREAIEICRSAGIHPVMITGDHPLTAKNIGTRLGLIDESAEIITGEELARMPLAEFEEHVQHIRVYARVAPEQKVKIVTALQDRGEIVAMTGDGVNDAPALKNADIGVAMGVTGTDVAKEASDMILLDDNFATIVAAVREGRRIYDNVRKFIRYTMTSNSGEIWTIFLAPFLGLPIPLLPIHILWINLVTDGLPGLALASERHEPDIMRRPPRHPQESVFAHGMASHILWVGLLMGAVSLIMQAGSIHLGLGHWQTIVFTVLTLSQMGHVLAVRSENQSLFTQGLFSNKPLLAAVSLTLLLQLSTVYVPFLQPIFKTQALTVTELGITLVASTIVFFAVEMEKAWRRLQSRQRVAPPSALA
ncbi:MAG: cation-translocating P-type ATPase [Actinomycetota bacterium]|nr:cation-translocating P-type ATPase [Actinomycetota bacterium]